MKLGAFMDPEYPIFSTTLCYLERDDAYLMLHRVKKEDDYNHDKWIGVGGKFERFETPMDWAALVLICFVLPAVLSVLFCEIERKLGWIKDGDLKLN